MVSLDPEDIQDSKVLLDLSIETHPVDRALGEEHSGIKSD